MCGMTSRPSRERRPPSRPEPGGPANVPCVTSNGGRPAPPPAAAPAKEALRESWTFESPDPMFDDPGRCSVCDTDLEVDGDLLLQCDGCRAPVHASCYGARGPPDPDAPLLTGPDGLPLFPQPTLPRPDHPWRCDPCAILGAGAGARTACEACPIIGGALVRAADPPPGAKRVPGRKGGVGGLRWVHVACALWCPELGFAGLGETPQPRGGVVGGVRIPAPIALAPQTIVPALAPTLAVALVRPRAVTFNPPSNLGRAEGLDAIPSARVSLRCSGCSLSGPGGPAATGGPPRSAPVQCAHPTCTVAWHPLCARRAGLVRLEEWRVPAAVCGMDAAGPGPGSVASTAPGGKRGGMGGKKRPRPTTVALASPSDNGDALAALGPWAWESASILRLYCTRHRPGPGMLNPTPGRGIRLLCPPEIFLGPPGNSPSAVLPATPASSPLTLHPSLLSASTGALPPPPPLLSPPPQPAPHPPQPWGVPDAARARALPADYRPRGVRAPDEAAASAPSWRGLPGRLRAVPVVSTGRRRGMDTAEAWAAPLARRAGGGCWDFNWSNRRPGPVGAPLPPAARRRGSLARWLSHRVPTNPGPTAPPPPSLDARITAAAATVSDRLSAGRSVVHGLGAVARVAHAPGDVVLEYCGEIVRDTVAEARETRLYDDAASKREGGCPSLALAVFCHAILVSLQVPYLPVSRNPQVGAGTYVFRLDAAGTKMVDATRAGNLAHLLNHSCDPNCVSRSVVTGAGVRHACMPVPGLPPPRRDAVLLLARRSIAPGEELTYDYRFSGDEALPCACGTAMCRGAVNAPLRPGLAPGTWAVVGSAVVSGGEGASSDQPADEPVGEPAAGKDDWEEM